MTNNKTEIDLLRLLKNMVIETANDIVDDAIEKEVDLIVKYIRMTPRLQGELIYESKENRVLALLAADLEQRKYRKESP